MVTLNFLKKGVGMPEAFEVEKEIRERLIEYFEWLSSYDYKSASIDPNEVINLWDDWVSRPFDEKQFNHEVYSNDELNMLRQFNDALDCFCNKTPQYIIEEHLSLPEWAVLLERAQKALELFITSKGSAR